MIGTWRGTVLSRRETSARMCPEHLVAISDSGGWAFQQHVRDACPALACLQDICTESRHAEMTRQRPSIDEARCHADDSSSGDFCSEDFDTPRLEIVLLDGRKLTFAAALDSAIGFWSSFLGSSRNRLIGWNSRRDAVDGQDGRRP